MVVLIQIPRTIYPILFGCFFQLGDNKEESKIPTLNKWSVIYSRFHILY